MEDLYSIHPGIPTISQDITDLMKAQIAGHPRYPSLLSAYIDCRKVGAPPELASFLEDIAKESYHPPPAGNCNRTVSDPELDEFMESYCQVLRRYKQELSGPFDEAKSFLNEIESQLNDLCKITSSTITTSACNSRSDEVGGSSEEIEASQNQEDCYRLSDQELKEMLLKKYSGYLSNLRKEFLKKKKKGKLPKDSRLIMLDWWNAHYRWPYPTEEEKVKLGEMTGLDQKQINNWFINQRKRHWKPSEDMRFALVDGVSSGANGTTLYFDRGPLGP